ncbi:MAG: SDR family oxidoreductase [Planctomycetota bacterium]
MSVTKRTRRPFLLLTGATGLLGGLVLARLLECQIPVAVMVRGNRRQSAAQRAEAVMRRLEERCERMFVRPIVIEADLCQPGLGLTPVAGDWIGRNCGSVVHSAANLLFSPASRNPYNEPYRTNLDGTRHLIDLAVTHGIQEWHYVSTAYIAGLRDGIVCEHELNAGQTFGNDYERSKAMAEQMLRSTSEIQSLTVYRPSIVIDLHPTASMRSDQTINIAFRMFQALSQRFGMPERGKWFRRLGFHGAERKNIVTVDWVSEMITEIWRRPQLHGRTYHLTNPTGTSVEELEEGFRAAVLSSGIRLPQTLPEWQARVDEQAAPFVEAFKPYFRDDPNFHRANTLRAMQVCDKSDLPELNVATIRDFCLRQSQPVIPAEPIALHESRWSMFVDEVACLQLADASNAIGLELCGPGGGQWVVEESSAGFGVIATAASAVTIRWICTASTWDALIDEQIDVEVALRNAVLLIERDASPSGGRSAIVGSADRMSHCPPLPCSADLAAIHRLLTAIRNRTSVVVAPAGEVARVR